MSNTSSFVLKVIKEALLIVDQERIVFVNKSFEDLCDFSSNQLLNDLTLLFFAEEESSAFFGLVKKHATGSPIFNEAIVEIKNRRSGPFLSKVTFHPFVDELENPKCVCIFSDPLFYTPIFETTSTLMGLLEFFEAESDCVLLRANKAVVGLFDIPQNDLPVVRRYLQRDLGFQLDEDDLAFLSESDSIGTPYARRMCVSGGENRILWLASTVTYVGRSLRNRSLFLFVAEDITNTVRLESEVKDSKQVVAGQRAFFERIVHELRSPLSGLLGMAALLRNTRLTSEQEGLIKTTETCGESILLLIGNLLDLGNLEHNKVVLANNRFDVVQCVEEALEIVSATAMEKGIELLYQLEDVEQPTIFKGDALRIRQVLLNLLSNALKFTEDKGGSIVVHLHRPESNGDGSVVVSFSVEDSGIRMPQEAVARIFDPFTQANPGINQRFGGSGLGLAVVQSLVHLMGGTVFVEQKQEGKGSIFHLSVVLRSSEREETDTESIFTGKAAAVSLQNEDLAKNLSKRLVALGMRVFSKVQEQPDVVFADSPSQERYSAVTFIRVGFLRPEGYAGEFLRKPIRSKALVAVLHQSLHLPVPPTTALRSKRPRPAYYFRVLLVDDNVLNRKVVQNLLEMAGCTPSAIYTASNGRDALLSLRQQMADIVLMDLEMPVMGGLEAAKEIRRRWPNDSKKPFVVALTGTATEGCKNECLAAGMNAFLTKPVRLDSLIEVIEEASTELHVPRQTTDVAMLSPSR